MIYSEKLSEKSIRKMTEESYIKTIYNNLQSKFEWKIDKKNDWRIVYSFIYYNLQSKFEWKMSKKNDWRIIYNSIYYDFTVKNWLKKYVRKMSQKWLKNSI